MQLLTIFQSFFSLRPLRMYRRKRPVVETFPATEQLYRRYRRADFSNGMILPSALNFPKKDENSGPSVNRSLLSKPKDVLGTDKGKLSAWGVYQFPVSCIPSDCICPTTSRRFTFFPKHVPLRNNYAHSEIWCDAIPRQNAGYIIPTSLVRKEVRAMIQRNSRPVILAKV